MLDVSASLPVCAWISSRSFGSERTEQRERLIENELGTAFLRMGHPQGADEASSWKPSGKSEPVPDRAGVQRAGVPCRYIPHMILTPAEEIAVRRAVTAYREMRNKDTKGAFRGVTADQILEELHPTPVRWVALASFVIARAEGEPPLRG
jgi:hypothetical protein